MNLYFFSALSGFIGTILIFFFGIPPKIDRDGHDNLICEGENKKEKKRYKIYKKISYFGVLLIAISFLIQLASSINRG